MAGMKRFVTYIYLYEDGKKGRNVGFAKVEIRGEDCRMEVHLRGLPMKAGNCQVYLFQTREGSMIGFPIGEMCVMNRDGDFGTIIKAGKIGDFPYGIYEMEGLCIISEEEKMFVSKWKEGIALEVSRERFQCWQPPQLKEESEVPPQTAANAGAENKPIRMPQPGIRHRLNAPTQPVQETVMPNAPTQPVQKTVIPNVSAQPVQKTVIPKTPTQPVQETPVQKIPQTKLTEQDEIENVSMTEIPMHNIFPQYDWCTIWEQLQKEHTVFAPYEDGKIVCMQIELKNLRELPKKYWYLGNNSFLLHGFFCYHYLIIGNMDGENWFLGIPGVYQQQERVMAAIFGFPEFLPASACKKETTGKEPLNQFGYWYRFIEE